MPGDPRCRETIGATDTVCPHCGYDFPDPPQGFDASGRPRRQGFAYSPFADLALIVGSLAAAFGCMVAGLFTAYHLVRGDLLLGLVYGPLAVLLQLGWLVVFLRVQDL